MDFGFRKKFMSPFPLSKATETDNHISPLQQGMHWNLTSYTPKSAAKTPELKSEKTKTSVKFQDSGLNGKKSINSALPRQKVSRSLFGIKINPVNCEKNDELNQESPSHDRKRVHTEKEGTSRTIVDLKSYILEADSRNGSLSLTLKNRTVNSFSGNDVFQIDNRSPSVSLELLVPKLPPEPKLIDSAPDCILNGEIIGQLEKVEAQSSFDFTNLIKPAVVPKFMSKVTPCRVPLPKISHSLNPATKLLISSHDMQECCENDISLSPKKEKLLQMPDSRESTYCALPGVINSLTRGTSVVENSREYCNEAVNASMQSYSSNGKRRIIRGFSVPRCGRLTNQSYQEQAKEFDEILSSKVRQIAEVADCLQHREVLYKILQM
ncbi:hypothetical protein KP509_23G060900 [Ceratopteris richardii]|uniref:Uncharacterized protein n=1 Tax=Ceratopteris richardii TaxID=49495 RepID=A0A8T2S3K8_CERRI|nr:hypothetical protein KP509_23G060900 [Ceratopteris richardii]